MNQPDLIIVGAGTAGCLLAAQLVQKSTSSSTGPRITVVEPPSEPAPAIDQLRPSRWLNLLGSSDDWDLQAEPSVGLANRRLAWPRGRGIGGSSRINAMIWFPPTASDWHSLVAASGGLWTVDQLHAAYESVRAVVKPERPLWLSEPSRRFLETVTEYPDATPMAYWRLNRRARRWTPASLLDQADQQNPRLEVVRASVDHVLWEHDRAVGVRLVVDGSVHDLKSSHGVVLCGGTIATPSILMRSGIGCPEQLKRHSIPTRVSCPSVGENLQDHLIMPVIFRTKAKSPFTLQQPVSKLAAWQTLGTGPVGSNIAECGGLFCGDSIQMHVTPTHYLTFPKPSDTPAMTLGVNLTRPLSRGTVTIGSSHIDDPPLINANYLQQEADRRGTIEAVQLVRRIAAETALAGFLRGELLPGAKRNDETSLEKAIARYAQTLYHPVGTCRLGVDIDAPIDPDFVVRGATGLWVVDASILANLTTGNPSAIVMTLAALAADSIMACLQKV